MNLRQKIKQAKKELKNLNKAKDKNSTWEIIKKVEKEIELQNIINYKRKFYTYCKDNDEYKIDWRKLTYISFNADFTELGVLKSPNGRPLKRQKVKKFMEYMVDNKFINYATLISQENKTDNPYRVDYYLAVSNDKTKDKKLYIEKLACQFRGESKIYHYKKEGK